MRERWNPPRRPIEAVLSSFFIAVHARFAREREQLPIGVEVIVFCVGTEPISRYDDASPSSTSGARPGRSGDCSGDYGARGGHHDAD